MIFPLFCISLCKGLSIFTISNSRYPIECLQNITIYVLSSGNIIFLLNPNTSLQAFHTVELGARSRINPFYNPFTYTTVKRKGGNYKIHEEMT